MEYLDLKAGIPLVQFVLRTGVSWDDLGRGDSYGNLSGL